MAPDPYKYFRVEARELLEQLGRGTLDLEKETPGPDPVARLLRLAHTLKGAARVVRQNEIADLAHAVEDTLAPYRDSAGPAPHDRIDSILKLLDEIGGRVAALASPATAGRPATPGDPSPGRVRSEEAFRTVRADIGEMDALLAGVTEAHVQLASLRRSLKKAERARQLAELISEQLASPRTRGVARSGNGASEEKARFLANELNNLFGTLDRNLASGIEQVDRELRQVRDAAERLRLVPAGTLFTGLERAARDVAQAQGKRVAFEGRGGEIRLDGHVMAAVQDALLQIVRNAVAHGIEREPERSAAGKTPEGRVTLEVTRRGRRVAFLCRDDGRGVDLEAVRGAVRRKGLSSTEINQLGSEELVRVLLRGGISTSGTVTEVSGRGIGLDVVREVAERLGGEVSVRTEPGKGTSVALIVPLTLASLEALVVETAGMAVALPLDAVRGCVRLGPDQVARTEQGDTIVHEGQAIPFLPLSRAVSVKASPARVAPPWSAVVVAGTSGAVSVGVDRLLGTATVVLRPLPDLVRASPTVAGASLDPEGNPQLVLDPDGLVAEAGRANATEFQPEAARSPILVVDDSLTIRMLEQSILESAGYEVDVATSGEEALEKARRKPYALFLVDIEMPGIDGLTFIERTRADSALKDIPSLLVTSRASPQDRQRGQEVGAEGYIVKSEFDQGEFLTQIRKLVG